MAPPLRRLRQRAPEQPVIRPSPPLGVAHPFAHNELRVRGTVDSASPVAELVVEVDADSFQAPVDNGGAFELSLDTGAWTAGERELTLRASNEAGAEGVWRGSVEVLPYRRLAPTREATEEALRSGATAIWLEHPEGRTTVAREGYFQVQGWAHSAAGLRGVVVTIDGGLRFEANHGLERSDLDGLVAGVDLSRSGFSVRIDARPLEPVRHTMTAVAIGADGAAVGLEWPLDVVESGGVASQPPEPRTPQALAETLASGEEPGADDAEAWRRLAQQWREQALWLEADAAASRAEKQDLVYAHSKLLEQDRAIQRSLSWRMTRPVRALGRLVRALRR